MKQWSRGRVRHFESPHQDQFVTFRLADSLPWDVHARLLADIDNKVPHALLKYDEELGHGYGSCRLRTPVASRIVTEELFALGEDVLVHAYVVMPNHVHILLNPGEQGLSKIMQLLKGRSARRINQALGISGTLWKKEYFDRAIRDEVHFNKVVHYIEWNPVKAGLVVHPEDYANSSASPNGGQRLASQVTLEP